MEKSCENCRKNTMYLTDRTECLQCANGEIDAFESYKPVVAIMNKPANCQECVFGICKYSHPYWTEKKPGKKGYYCQLKSPSVREVEEFDYEQDVHLSECPLKPIPQKQVILQTDTPPHRYAKVGYNFCIDELLKENSSCREP